jgi:hypothetical protein
MTLKLSYYAYLDELATAHSHVDLVNHALDKLFAAKGSHISDRLYWIVRVEYYKLTNIWLIYHGNTVGGV